MDAPAHRKKLAALLRETLSVYSGFAEVDEIREILVAWESGRFSIRGGVLVHEMGEAPPTGSIPPAIQPTTNQN